MLKIVFPLLVIAGFAAGWTPDWQTPFQLTCGGLIIDVGWYGAPCVVDWDGDGVKDLILGQFSSGNIRFYKNEGTNENPVFNSYSLLYADGSPISVPSG